MQAKLQLYLRGAIFTDFEIDIPNYDYELDFEANCKIRTSYVEYEKEKLSILYLRQILKCEKVYQIYLVVGSRVV